MEIPFLTKALRALIALLFAFSVSTAVAGDLEDGVAAFNAKKYEKALLLLQPAADQGVATAQGLLGRLYANGWGVPKNFDVALKWARLAAAQGNGYGQTVLGYMYQNGFGVEKNYEEAARWYLLAAEQGSDYEKKNLQVEVIRSAADRVTALDAPRKRQEQALAEAERKRKDELAQNDAEKMRLDLELQRQQLERDRLALERDRLAAAPTTLQAELVATAPSSGAASTKRVALVIGNASYRTAALRNPGNDARAISQKLRLFGYDVILKENLKARDIGSVMAEFSNRITPGAEALFFYAGHGVQLRGENFLPTVDSEIRTEFDLPTQSIALNRVVDLMHERKAALSLVLLDAYRNNPFLRASRSIGRGLAQVNAPSGTLLSYATRPGSITEDGDGSNGVYTTFLLKDSNRVAQNSMKNPAYNSVEINSGGYL